MTLLEEEPRVESEDNGDVAYNVAKELFNKYPDLKGIMGTSSFDAPGVARAIEELGLTGKDVYKRQSSACPISRRGMWRIRKKSGNT